MRTNFNRILSNGKVNTVVRWVCLSTVIIAIVGLLLLVGVPFPYLINNYRLDSFAGQLAMIPLPSQTERVGVVIKNFGNLGTCSKHGDYYAEFKIISTLPFPQLKRFYDQFHVQVPDINNIASTLYRGLGTHGPTTVEIKKIEGTKNKYVIYAFDPDYWPNDFRCW
ncbi:MAG: hypothetical protein FD145_614 [Candidatus Saganbacteria bacterium]|uniref:Uncharacterized protein n=1 Tax=Candidatus Saganbacteria bacterium TaxID=2575572 RepID=A0A833P070_UNCSA|nr:MAG: hypothetical protein FD145_614 [Candidatus Saganbacteria bacterium]